MELRHIRYFLAVADEGNFTRAAARVGIAQPPLSQQIRDLEREVGAPLFHRVPHGAELTEAGRAFRDEVARVPETVAAAVRSARRAARGESGALRVGFTGTAAFNPLVPAAIRTFRRRFPEVETTLVERNSASLAKDLVDGTVDVAFLRPGALDLAGLVARHLADEPMVAALPATHPALDDGDSIPLAAMKDDPFLLTPRAAGPSVYDVVVEACRAAGFEPILGQTAPQMASLLTFVAAELGVSVVLASMRQVAPPGVAFRRLADGDPTVALALVHGRAPGPVVRNFVAAVAAG